jgi:hypothetical protein
MQSMENKYAAGPDGVPAPAPQAAWAESQAPVDPALQRILYVVSQFPSLSETFIVREIQTLIDRGMDVRILSLKQSREHIVQPQAAALLDRVMLPASGLRTLGAAFATLLHRPSDSLTFLAIMLRELWRRPAALAKSMVAIFRALGRIDEIGAFSPQLLHAPWATYPATVAWFLSRVLEVPYSFTSRAHDIFIEDHMMAGKLQSAALAVTITEHNVRFMERWMPASGAIPVHVVHSALNLAELPYVRTGRDPRKLLSVGRLVPMKGFDILLKALAELRDRGIEFSCTVIGEGPERTRLENMRRALGLDALVDFPGAMPQDEVTRHMTDSSLIGPAMRGCTQWAVRRDSQCPDGIDGNRATRHQHADIRNSRTGRGRRQWTPGRGRRRGSPGQCGTGASRRAPSARVLRRGRATQG